MNNNIIKDVITRTSGELYLGVVGSVRSGKSTFIRKFLELKVLPYIKDDALKNKVIDELPQSGDGTRIMTVEPKFVPSDQVKISIDENISFKTRLIDCVGYIIPSAQGYLNDDGTSRLVQTPWFSEGIPFNEAATIGTQKVIENHANIGIVVTSDGSFGSFKREEYEHAEELIIKELKDLNKPFIVVLNTVHPNSEETNLLVDDLKIKYDNCVVAIDVLNIKEEDIDKLLKEVLNEFDISELSINIPNWIEVLDDNITYKHEFNEAINNTTATYRKMKDVVKIRENLESTNLFENVNINEIDPSTGKACIDVCCSEDLYKELIEEIIGEQLDNKGQFISILQTLKKSKEIYDLLGSSIQTCNERGYDIAVPPRKMIELSTPELFKASQRYGIKIKAVSHAVGLIKLDIESSFEPIIGQLEQAEGLIKHMQNDFETDIEKLWNSEIFGRKLSDVIIDGINSKVNSIDDGVMIKYKEALEKVVNHGKGGVIAIML